MAILHRRGANADFNAQKMLAGEMAVTIDGTRKVYAAFAPGDVKELASKEDVQNIVDNFTDSVDKKISEAVGQVTTEAEEQIAAVMQKGEEVLESIPENYQEIAEDVAKHENDIATLTQSKADAIVCSASGEIITATDSADAGFEQFRTFGWGKQEKTSGKNLLENTATSQTVNGVTFTVNEDGSVTANGTATARAGIIIADQNTYTASNDLTYMLSGCPTNGSDNSYYMHYHEWDSAWGDLTNVTDYGNGVFMEHNNNAVYSRISVEIASGYTCNNLTFKPMIRLASIEDATYEPYTGGQASPNPEYPQPIVGAGQKLAEGTNLLDMSKAKGGTNSGLTIEVLDNGSYSVKGTATQTAINVWLLGDYNNTSTVFTLPAGNYYCSDAFLYSYDGTTRTKYANAFTLSADTPITAMRVPDATSGKTYDTINYPMINKGLTALPWEPYTGGVKAAYDVGISKKLTGKNLLKNTAVSKTINGVTFTVNEDGSVTANGTATARSSLTVGKVTLPAGSYIMSCGFKSLPTTGMPHVRYKNANGEIIYVDPANYTKKRFTLEAETTVSYVAEVRGVGVTVSNLVFKPMIRNADIEDDTYEPYTEQTLTLNRVLRGIPVTDTSLANYTDENGQMWCADEIDVERGVLVQRINNVVANGANQLYYDEKFDTVSRLSIGSYKEYSYTINRRYGYSSHLPFVDGYSLDEPHWYVYNGYSYVFLPNEIATSQEEIDAWLANGNSIQLQYILATPIETALTDEEIAAYKALHTNKPTTVITNDAGCMMAIEYVADPKNHIEQNYVPVSKYTALEERVSALEQLHV